MAEKYFNKLIKLRREQSQHFYFIYAYLLAFKGKISDGEQNVAEMLKLGIPVPGGFCISTVALFHATATINSLDHMIGKYIV